MTQKIIHTNDAPAAIGPYVQGRKIGNLLFTSGQIPFIPASMTLVEGGIEEQTQQALKNLMAIVEAAGGNKESVVKTTVFIKDMDQFGVINGVYAKFFGDHKPARSCVEVARLPKDVGIEIEAIAQID
jgi:2-iminobutanoate/2-iminopropanoate deaminase